jgi:hypothetical protein
MFSGDTIYVDTTPLNIYDLINTNSGLTGDTSDKIKINVDGTSITFNESGQLKTAITPLAGTKTYYVSDSSGGAVTRKLTFFNGILISED